MKINHIFYSTMYGSRYIYLIQEKEVNLFRIENMTVPKISIQKKAKGCGFLLIQVLRNMRINSLLSYPKK